VWQLNSGSTEEKAQAAIEKTEAFFNDLGIDTKLSQYTKDYEGTAEKISERFIARGWLGIGEHKNLKPEDVAKIVAMAY
jgi:NADP-dependent alcohol dehydrogenase